MRLDVKKAIESRRSIRKYKKKEIPETVMDDLLDAARKAPSSSNKQAWKLIVVTDEEMRRRLVPVSGNQSFVGDCSAYLVGVSEPEVGYSPVDITIALDHLSLRAVELGLGTCWIGDFEPMRVKEILGVPVDHDVPVCMTLGYPSTVPAARKRKDASVLFRKDIWGQKWE
jgi:nitroreductase